MGDTLDKIGFDADTQREVAGIFTQFNSLQGMLNAICMTYARARGEDPARWQLAKDGSGLVRQQAATERTGE